MRTMVCSLTSTHRLRIMVVGRFQIQRCITAKGGDDDRVQWGVMVLGGGSVRGGISRWYLARLIPRP
jgi:hypothetical protein